MALPVLSNSWCGYAGCGLDGACSGRHGPALAPILAAVAHWHDQAATLARQGRPGSHPPGTGPGLAPTPAAARDQGFPRPAAGVQTARAVTVYGPDFRTPFRTADAAAACLDHARGGCGRGWRH